MFKRNKKIRLYTHLIYNKMIKDIKKNKNNKIHLKQLILPK
jgi:hypothetical protein